ncbi:hypothetical protein B4102_3547 [Heyndrickxia sporothermodurans]|uniref:Uncharacterized protein n=1 Tax=Heyndrickxia sporothermodurans TaxID=46224 RepID=A0A150KLY0_9BACI|nr:hypothetical protein B4102_3547 [Heyndrickxia sporothermodurans]
MDGATIEQITVNYQNAHKEYFLPFLENNEYMLENYLVHYMFKTLFPILKDRVFDDYVMLVIHYSMVKLHLIGMAKFHNGLNEELVIKLIQSFSKTVDHSAVYLSDIFEALKKQNFNTMGYMAILANN